MKRNIKTIFKKILEIFYNFKISKNIFIVYLILSLMVIIPFQISDVSAQSSIKTAKEANSLCFGGSGVDSPKDSLILSVLTLCLPGILENINDYQQIRCQEVICQYEAIKIGIDSTFCAEQKAYQTCTQITGEMFNLPFLNTIDMFKDLISNLLTNPNPTGFLWSIGAKAARKVVGKSPTKTSPIIGVSAVFLAVTDLLAVAQTLTELSEMEFFEEDNEYCADVEKIVEELEKIVEVS